MSDYFTNKHGTYYGYEVHLAIRALVETNPSLVGDTAQARELILALCDQAGAPIGAQRTITALLGPSSSRNTSDDTKE